MEDTKIDHHEMTVTDIRNRILATKVVEKKELTEAQKENQERLIRANDSFLHAVQEDILNGIENAFSGDDFARSTLIFSPDEDANLEGLSWMTIVKGFYNSKKKYYSRRPHHQAGILQPPLDVLKDRMRPLGVTDIVDVSDIKKGRKFVLRVDFTYDM